jgi:hypothetical protein
MGTKGCFADKKYYLSLGVEGLEVIATIRF